MSNKQPLNFPLHWPSGWPRSDTPQDARFSEKTTKRAVDELYRQLEMLGVDDDEIIVSSNMGGLSRSAPDDRGVAVYFPLDQLPIALACDRWRRIEHNVWAIAKHVEAMRSMERWGVGNIARMFTGYTAIGAGTPPKDCWTVLGLPAKGKGVPSSQIDKAYAKLARKAHPDVGGSHEAMVELNRARDDARASLLS